MSTTIDQRVVEMQFDNRHFENNVATTMSSLDKLKQSLNFSGAAKGFEDVDSAARKVDMGGLGAAVEAVQMKFSALQIMGVTALSNITNSAVNAGKRIASALTIEPIKTGLAEYETQINAVQTILANTESKGTTLEDVNGALDTLNKYADKTIYNFTEMTRNIGTFTAAGVDLDTSVNAIQGIANLAAVSGSTSQQASTAMYQLSQALSSGTVKLMDWNSVVNAGMGGQVFQDALKETARVHGIAIDDMIKENGSFRETLQEGWLTADILTETLSKFTMGTEGLTEAEIQANREKLKTIGYTDEQIEGIFKLGNTATNAATKVKTFTQLWDTLKETAQSGWTQTWELIFGDFEGAKSFFSDLYGTIAPLIEATSNARNELLKGWNEAGGRNDLIDSLYNIIEAIGSIIKPIKEAFRDIFPPMTVDQLVSFTKGLKEFTAGLKLSDETSDKLKRTFKGLFAVVDIVRQVFKGVGKAIGSLFGSVTGLSGGILDITATIGDWLVALRNGIDKSEIFGKALNGIVTVVKFVMDGLKALLGFTGGAFSAFGSEVSSAFDSVSKSVEECSLVRVLKTIWTVVKTVVFAIIDVFRNMARGIGQALGGGNYEDILNIITGIVSGGIGISLIKFIKSLSGTLDGASGILENIGGIFENVGGVFENLGGVLEGFTAQVKSKALMNIAIAIGILAASLLVLSLIDSDKLYDSIVAIGALFAGLMVSLSFVTKTGEAANGLVKIGTTMIAISAAILILAFALKTIADLNFNQLAVGLAGVAALMAIMVVTMKVVGKSATKATKHALRIVIFAAAVKVLASVLIDLSTLSWEELARGLTGVAGVMGVMVVTMKLLGKSASKATKHALQVVLFAAAIKILASACTDLSGLSWEEIARGLTGVAGLMVSVLAFTKLSGKSKNLISTGIAVIAIAAAMKILASAVQDMSAMSWESLARGLLGIAGALVAVVVALKLMPKNILGSSVGFVIVAAGLVVLAEALSRIGNMTNGALNKGLTALCISLGALAIALNLMKHTTTGSAALIIAAGAIAILTPALDRLGKMSWVAIAKGLIMLAGAFTIIGVAGAVLGPMLPVLLGLAGVFVKIGAGIALLGIGLVAIGAGLTSIAAGIATIIATLAGSTITIIDLIAGIVTGIAKGIAEGIIAICEVISRGLPAIGKAIKAIVVLIVEVLVECIPIMVEGVLQFVVKLLDSLARVIPQIVDSLFDLLVGILEGLAKRLPELIGAVVDIIVSLVQGIIDALGNAKLDISLESIINLGALTGFMFALAALAPLVPTAMAGVVGLGILVAELAVVLAAVGALAQIPGLSWLINEGGGLLEAIGTAIGRFIGGIAGGFAQGFTSSLPAMATDLSNFMYNLQPFVEGAKLIDSSVVDGVKSVVGVILAITGADVLQHLAAFVTGGSSIKSFSEDLPILGRGIGAFADEVSGISAEDVAAAAEAGKALAEMTSVIPNEGGVAAWFAGENSASKWGTELPKLGIGLKAFSESVEGVNIENVKSAADAAKALAEMTATIPNEGGVAAWFAGENSLSKFSKDIIQLGKGLASFSESTTGVNVERVTLAVEAAKSIAELSNTIPNQGGVVSWFTGDNSLAKFAGQFPVLGKGLSAFSTSVEHINAENVSAAINAAKAIAEMTNIIPNQGGMVTWFTGDNSLANFAFQLPVLGSGLLRFSNSVAGVNAENVTAAANAAKAIADITNTLPNEGGIVAWFTGDNSLARFAHQLPVLGLGLKSFATSTIGINSESIVAAANAAKALAEMTNTLPNSGGVVAWFSGETSIAKFSSELGTLGLGLKIFSVSVEGIQPESIGAAANAAKSLADMTATLPNEGGVKAWFAGETSIANFASQLPILGLGLKMFSTSVEGINAENVTAAANAAKALAEMTAVIPTEGGIKAWFTGETSISNFADKLPALGEGLKGFSDSVEGISPENVTAAANAAKSLGQMTDTIPKNTDKIAKFGDNLIKFGEKLASYFSKTSGITAESVSSTNKAIKAVEKVSKLQSGNIKSVSDGVNDLAKSLKNLSKIPKDSTSKFSKAMEELGKTSADKLVKALEKIEKDTKKAGEGAMDAFIKGIESKTKAAKTACTDIAKACAKAIGNETKSFSTAGKNLVEGFASGISTNTYKAAAKAKAMAKAAADAAKKALDINSPSKVFRAIGTSIPEGFAAGIDKFTGMVETSSTSMADAAVGVVGESIASLADLVGNGVDAQPTIRPVLDLSDVQNKARSINSLFGDNSVGVLANVGSISSAMNSKAQNRGNDDVVSAIKDLRKDFEKFKGDTYNFGNIAYNDDTEVQNAVHTLVRAVKIGRRV